MPGMWYALEKIFAQDGVTIGAVSSTRPPRLSNILSHLDKAQSFFVGDAAGRVYSKTKKDFASTDRKWALNLDLKFFTPEVISSASLPGYFANSSTRRNISWV